MKDFQEKLEQFLRDLSLTVPYLQSYEMMDWLILAVSFVGMVMTLRSRVQGLFLLSIADVLWASYDFYIGEYAQGTLFLFYFGMTAWGCLLSMKEKKL